jgi:phosphoribosylformimino-5-aminoimidazole carboxamide ribonucleotide (ProFAR) isomerase
MFDVFAFRAKIKSCQAFADLRLPRIANLHTTSTTIAIAISARMTRFRPCIDLHAGSVKQIVGGTLSTTLPDSLKTNWTSEHPSAYYADLYKRHGLTGAHVIMLGPGNDEAAKEALGAWQNSMQVGGGITEKNAADWIARGAERVSLRSRPRHGNIG